MYENTALYLLFFALPFDPYYLVEAVPYLICGVGEILLRIFDDKTMFM
jgi:hypothetical protein